MGSGPQRQVVIVGAGFGGIAAAIQLLDNGIDDFEILEAADGVGGTWRFNDYPGSACDVPAHLYSYSFAQRRDWERLCPTQPVILDYVERVARDFGVTPHVTFGSRVVSCIWSDVQSAWEVRTDAGRTVTAGAVVVATGQLHQPAVPNIDGLDSFAGALFHSAEWDHSIELAGKRVAMIGTGATSAQAVPAIAPDTAHLDVFQRTGNWYLPRRNRFYPKPVLWALERLPGLQAFRRRFIYWYGEGLTLMIRHPKTIGLLGRLRSELFMRWQVKDPDLRRRLKPDYTFGCKRVLFSSFFLPALQLPNVDLVTEPIERITATAIVTADGVPHDQDVIILGTGFKAGDFMFPMEIIGLGGRSLREAWDDGPHAYLGMAVPGFPSLFLMYGPNTNTSGGSILVYLEAQAKWIRQALVAARERGAAAVSVRADVEAARDAELQQRFRGTAWTGCDSWYRDEGGRIITNWPGFMHEYEAAAERFEPTDFEFVGTAAS